MAAGDLSLAIAISATDSATGVIKNIANSLAGLAGDGALGALATGAVAATTALAGIGIAAAKSAGDFQQSLNMLVTSAGESASNLKMVGDGILQISTDTGTATSDLSSAMYNINSGGKIGADGLAVLRVASEGAKTENADLTTVTKALMTTMTDYKLPTQDATGAMNGLIAAVQNGRTTLQDMASAMGQVLPVASSMGMSFPQVAGALDALTNAGVGAQQGAQNLAHFLVALQAPGGVAQKSMQEVGISAQDLKDTLVSKGLPAALQMIEDHISQHLPAGSIQAETAMKNITGGLVGLKTAADITGQGLQKTIDATNKIAAAMGDASNGVMGWDTVQTGFNFQIDRASAAINALLIVLGQQLLPILTPIVAGFTNLVGQITNWVSSLNSSGGAATSFSTILQSMGINVQALDSFLGKLGETFNNIWGIISKVATIVGDVFNIAMQLAGDIIGDLTNRALPGMSSGLSGVNASLTTVNNVLQTVVDALNYFSQNVSQLWSVVGPIFDSLANTAIQWGTNFINGFGQGIESGLSGIVDMVMQVMTEIESYLGFASPTRKGPGQNVNKWGLGLAQGLAVGMLQGIPEITDAAGNMMSATVTATKPTTTTTQPVQSMGSGKNNTAAKSLTTGLSQSLSSGASALTSGVNAIGAQLDTVCSKHATSASSCASSKLTTGLASSLSSGTSKVKAASDSVGNATSGVGSAADKNATTAAKSLTDGLTSKIKAATPVAKKAATDLGTAIAGAVAPPMKVASDAVNSLANDINNKLKSAGDAAKNALAPLSPVVEGVKNALAGLGTIFDQIKVKVQSAIDYMKPGLQSLADVFNTRIKPGLDAINTALEPLKKAAADVGGGALKAAGQFLQWATSTDTLKKAWDILVALGKGLMDALGPIIAAIGPALTTAIKGCSNAWTTEMLPAFKSIGDTVKQNQPLFDALGKFLGGVLLLAIGVVVGALTGLITGLSNVAAGLAKAVGGVVEMAAGIFKVLTGFVSAIYDLFTGNFRKCNDDVSQIEQGLIQIFKGAWDTISGLFQASIGNVIGFVSGFVKGITTYFQNLSNDLVGHSIIPDMINSIMDWWNKLVTFVPDFMNKIIKFFTDGWTNVQKGAETVLQTINTYWTTYSAAGLKLIQDGWTKIQEVFASAYTTYIQKPLQDLQTSVTTWATGLITTAAGWGANLIKGFSDAITAGIPNLTTVVTNVANTIKSFLGISSPAQTGPLSTSDTWMPNLMTMFSSQITAGTPAVKAATTGVANAVSTSMDTTIASIKASIVDLQSQINALKTTATSTATSVSQSMITASNSTNAAVTAANVAMTKLNADNAAMIAHTWTTTTTVDTANQQMLNNTSAAASIVANTSKDTVNTVTSTAKVVITQTQVAQQGADAAKNDAASAGSYAGLSQAQLAAAAASEHSSMVAELSARSNAQMSKGDLQNANAAANGSVSAATSAATSANTAGTDAAAAGSYANLSQAQLAAAAASEHAALISANVSKTNAQMSKSELSTSNAAANGSVAAAADSTSSASISKSALQNSNAASSGAVAAAAASTSSALSSKNSSSIASSNSAVAHDTAASTQAYIIQQQGQISAEGASMVSMAQSFAAAAAALVAHSTPKTGPMAGDDQWTAHFMDNLINPIQQNIPRLANVVAQVATTIASPLANPNGMLALSTNGAVAMAPSSESEKPMVIHLDLAGKEIGKYVTSYLAGEVRVQGGVRNR